MAADAKVLVVDDDTDVLTALQRGLELSDFTVFTATDGGAALRAVDEHDPDVMVLDLNLPVLDGVGVVTALRAMHNDVPVCVLSARSAVDDRITGLEAGADDYLVKPFEFGELVARLRALLRRRPEPAVQADGDAVRIGPVLIDLPGRRVEVAGTEVHLTKREFELLAELAENAGIVLSREQLLRSVWGYDFEAETNVVDVFVSYLRRKLEIEGAPRVLHTVRGVGFVLRER
ncbi:response regulator transcription factor [Rhodococcus sp. D2-41]|uniref:Response regulator transcription factor n=1 Tax=Speluncibacter jeojiensis TaxID=2710754 RepID=A0A9X4RDD1_9ACTN|nr:response regulator transcription factor [Rhodococcus sp. D2-41]MDG3009734.1 response regulator transcription factor [Rhodococcus sp. D2-41]MDG3014483.1 response regulator transcription factor [Corynebacteriales bacterium D3-21]